MTCPPDVRYTTVAPLFPRHHLQPDDDRQRSRDLQVWPRTMRETADSQFLHRTAGIKHHLRKMAQRDDMLSCYEHDFAAMSRPNPNGRSTGFGATLYGTGGKPGTTHRDNVKLAATERISINCPPPKAWDGEDSAVRTPRSSRSAREQDVRTIGYSTMSKMNAMQAKDEPMRLTVNGWGDTRWSPKSHPSMVLGMSGKRVALVQTTNIMNLRAADLPWTTR